jgi:acetolactate synthase-1/2/3 large subunit
MFEQQTVASLVANFLKEKQVPAIFQLSGGMIAFLTDAIAELNATRIINNRHEQASGFAAEGASRVSGIPHVAMGTSGPGMTNLVTPIASSFFDSVPVIYITGQVNQKEIRANKAQRQNGFQELDIAALVGPITKKVFTPRTFNEVEESLNKAWTLCQSGRKGPVVIDIPIDVQQMLGCSKSEVRGLEKIRKKKNEFRKKDLNRAFDLLSSAKRPLILLGGGVHAEKVENEIKNFIEKTQIPFVSSLMGLGRFATTGYLNLGFIGAYGNRWANEALSSADVLLVLGSRLDTRQVPSPVKNFTESKTIIRVDIDQLELEGRIKADLQFNSGIKNFLSNFNYEELKCDTESFTNEIKELRFTFPQESEQPDNLSLNPSVAMRRISEIFSEIEGYVVDVGQHQMWAAQSLILQQKQQFITSGGLGAMGFAIPAGIGATVATNKSWMAILGDGCLQLSSPELATLVQYDLPLVVCLINNRQHGMVAQFQDEYLSSRYNGTRTDYSQPDFSTLVKSYGICHYFRIETLSDIDKYREQFLSLAGNPIFIELIISTAAKALPKQQYIKED